MEYGSLRPPFGDGYSIDARGTTNIANQELERLFALGFYKITEKPNSKKSHFDCKQKV